MASLTAALAALASAQSIALMQMTADGQSAVTVTPGTPVRIEGVVSWTLGPQTGGGWRDNTFSSMHGGIVVDANAGTATNFSSHFAPSGLTNHGVFSGGSRPGMSLVIPPDIFCKFIIPPAGNSAGILVGGYDLTLSDPGVYAVNWTPAASDPNIRLYPTYCGFSVVPVPATYFGATITVTPAPASAPLLLALAAAHRRRPARHGAVQ